MFKNFIQEKNYSKWILLSLLFLSGIFFPIKTFALAPVVQVKNPMNSNFYATSKIYSATVAPASVPLWYTLVNSQNDCKETMDISWFKPYIAWSNITLTDETDNNKFLCFAAKNPQDEVGVAFSSKIVKIDKTAPNITITYDKPTTEDSIQSIKADFTDNNGDENIVATKYWTISWTETCSEVTYKSLLAKNYLKGAVMKLDSEDYNDKAFCFWVRDQAGNVKVEKSPIISGIDRTPPVIEIKRIGITTSLWLPTHNASASATDPHWPVKMWSIPLNEDIVCGMDVIGMNEYTPNTVIHADKSLKNSKICFKAKDFYGNYSFWTTNFDMSVDTCGDGLLDVGEQCDDGNRENNDGCSKACQLEAPKCSFKITAPITWIFKAPTTVKTELKAFNPLGHDADWVKVDFVDYDTIGNGGIKNPTTVTNKFDSQHDFSMAWKHKFKGQVSNNLQASATVKVANNVIRPITICSIDLNITGICGDGVINQFTEQCDDSNNNNNDGCSYNCQLEVPKCELIPSVSEGATTLNVNFTFKSDNTTWASYTKFTSWIDGDAPILNPTTWISKTYTGENKAFLPRLEMKNNYAGAIATWATLPKGLCGTTIGTMKHQKIEHTLPVRLNMAGTCFASQPVMIIQNLKKIYSIPHADSNPEANPTNANNLWNESEPFNINWNPVNIPDLSKPLDRRYANTFQFHFQYSGCYQVNNVNVIGETNNAKVFEGNNIPNTTYDFPANFPNADILNEDRITDPINKKVKLNIGFKHYKPDDISGEYTKVQEGINEYHPFNGDNGFLTVGVQDSHNTEKFVAPKKQAYLYPYCYVYPKVVLKGAYGRNQKLLVFTYLGCDVLDTLNLGFETKQMKRTTSATVDFENLGNLMFKNQINNHRYTVDELKNITELAKVPNKPKEPGIEDYFFADRNFKPCINVDYDGDGKFCNSLKDIYAVSAFDQFTLDIDFFTRLMPKWIKTKFPTPYLIDIVPDPNDPAKDLFYSLYKEIQKQDPRISMKTTDTIPANDRTETHHEQGHTGYGNVPFYPMVTINEFKVTYATTWDQDKLQNLGILRLNYNLEQIIDETHNIFYTPYAIIKFFDPYGNEIPLLQKKIDLVLNDSMNKNWTNNVVQYIPIVLDTVFPDGIYSVKMEIFDKFDKKIERDQYTSFFKNVSWPQNSVVIKEVTTGRDGSDSSVVNSSVKVLDTFNNGYIIDGSDFWKGLPLLVRTYLHNPIEDLFTVRKGQEDYLVVNVNGKDYNVPVKSIKKDTISDKNYFDMIWVSDEQHGKVQLKENTLNTIGLRDKYGNGNLWNNIFNLITVRNENKGQPSITENFDDYTLKIGNIGTSKIDLPIVEQDNVFGVYNFNKDLWFFDKNGYLIVKNFANEVISKVNLKEKYGNEIFKRIKILDDGSVLKYTGDTWQIKSIYYNNNKFSPSNLVGYDYDNKRKIGFGVTRQGVIKVFKGEINSSMFGADWGQELINIGNIPWNNIGFSQNDVSLSTVYIPTTNSYELFVVVKGRLLGFNYSVEDERLLKDYWPLSAGFANSLPYDGIRDIDVQVKEDKINIFAVNQYNSKVSLITLPFIYFKNNNLDQYVNLFASSTLPMSFYKKMIPPTAQVTMAIAYDDDQDNGLKILADIRAKEQLTLRAYTKMWALVSAESALLSNNFIGFDKYELYNNWNKVTEYTLTTEREKKGDKTIPLQSIWNNNSTNTFILKGINYTYGSAEVVVPVVKYLFSANIGDVPQWLSDWTSSSNQAPKVFKDGKYSGSVKFFDKVWTNAIGSYGNQQFLVINNKIYGYIPVFMNRTGENGVIKNLDYLNGWRIEVTFSYEGKTFTYSIPFTNNIVSQYSMLSKKLIDADWNAISLNDLVDQPKIDSLKTYIRSIPWMFINKTNFVEKNFTNNIDNWDFESYDQLFICMSDEDATKLSYKMDEIYKVLYDNGEVITTNEMDLKEYLNKKYEERKKAFKETKYQHVSGKNDCFLISDLLK